MNKKLLVGVAGVSILGVAAIASIIAANSIRNKSLEKQENAKKQGLLESNDLTEFQKVTAASKITFDSRLSVFSPKVAKLVFNLPKEQTGKLLKLYYKRNGIEDDKLKVAVLATTASETAVDVVFLLDDLNVGSEYQYRLEDESGTLLFFSKFITQQNPTIVANGAFRAADLVINNLASYQGESLTLKAVPKSLYDTKGKAAFQESLLIQEVNVRDKETSKNVWFKPAGFNTLKDETEYVIMLFSDRALVEVLTEIATFTTSLNRVEIQNLNPSLKTATLKLANLKPYENQKLKLAYKKVDSTESSFLPVDDQVKFVEVSVPTFAEDKETSVTVSLSDLTAESVYKLQVFDSRDTKNNDPFLTNAIAFRTLAQPKVSEVINGIKNPYTEVRAANIKIENIQELDISALKLKYQLKPTNNAALLDWDSSSELIKEVSLSRAIGENFASAEIKSGLEADKVYVFQLFAGDTATEALLESNNEFTTKKTISAATQKAPIGDTGKTSTTLSFSGLEISDLLAQFYTENGINEIELRYKKKTDDSWDTATKIKSKITKTGHVYSLEDFKLSSLTSDSEYEYDLFVAPYLYSSILDQPASFLTRETVTAEAEVIEPTRMILYTNALKSYVGNTYKIKFKKDSTEVPSLEKTGTVAENGIIFANVTGLETNSTYSYEIEILDSTSSTYTQIAKKDSISTSSITAPQKAKVIESYPTSFKYKFENLGSLKNKDLTIVYRVKDSNDIIFGEDIKFTADSSEKFLNDLAPLTDYEFNFVLKATKSVDATDLYLFSEWVSAKTKDTVTVTISDITQTSIKASYEKLEDYKSANLILKYVEFIPSEDKPTPTSKTWDDLSASAKQSTVVVDNEGKAQPTTVSFLNPNTVIAYQLFNNGIAVSELKTTTTEKQVNVASVTSYITDAYITLNDLNTIKGEGSNKLKLVVAKKTAGQASDPSWGTQSDIITVNFDNDVSSKSILVQGLTANTDYIVQVFKQSDQTYANALITTAIEPTAPLLKRTFKTLETDKKVKVEVTAISPSSARIKISQLEQYAGQKLVFKYRPRYWNEVREHTIDVPKDLDTIKVTTLSGDEKAIYFVIQDLDTQDKNLKEFQEWFYDVWADISGDSTKVLVSEPADTKEGDKENVNVSQNMFKTSLHPKVETAYSTNKTATITISNLVDYKDKKIQLRFAPKPTGSATVNWSAATGITATALEQINVADKNATKIFDIYALNVNSEYIYQFFVEGLNTPLLKENGEIKTKDTLILKNEAVETIAVKLLLSNFATYNNQTLKVEYTNTADSTKKTITLDITDNSFTSEMLLPIIVEGLEANKEYKFNIKLVQKAATGSTAEQLSANLLANDLTVKTLQTVSQPMIYTKDNKQYFMWNLNDATVKSLAGRPLVLKLTKATETNEYEFTLPETDTEYEFSPQWSVTNTDSSEWTVSLESKASVNANKPINLLGTSPVKFKASESMLKPAALKSDKVNEVKDKKASDYVSTEKKSELEGFLEVPTLANYTVSLESASAANDVEGSIVLNYKFTKDSKEFMVKFSVTGFKKEEPAAQPSTSSALVLR
ncbi:lipoprotein 17-related variable surface protein [Mycoplasma iguanae]|uniref:Lipoprotein 17-related variable surface protein n=1 Tax=Mycoplasma iguanae TaxID=292461 RepID=A0ABY5R7Z0_9MOLU|nr:lipoprotein 17-related variable surface protein [Mycoplasma iguanae]UVD81604.1 lipoprotein 17-related variable surface protein [Mycoplasma iguanae]